MNYYIDFDHTLYNTPKLTKDMLNTISNFIAKKFNLDVSSILSECKIMFNRDKIYNIYDLVEYFAKKYNFEANTLILELNSVIYDSKHNVFEDSISFLEKLKEQKHNIYLLSYCEFGLEFQTAKILGSGLIRYFDSIIITGKPKWELDLDFTQGIFIDDKPEDLINLFNKTPKDIIRIRRPGDTYSKENIEHIDMKEYTSLYDIPILN